MSEHTFVIEQFKSEVEKIAFKDLVNSYINHDWDEEFENPEPIQDGMKNFGLSDMVANVMIKWDENIQP